MISVRGTDITWEMCLGDHVPQGKYMQFRELGNKDTMTTYKLDLGKYSLNPALVGG